MAWFRKKKELFQPDRNPSTFVKTWRLSRQQKRRLTRWSLYAAATVLCQVVQNVILSRTTFLGATTELGVVAIFLIGLLEGTEAGSLWLLIASLIYYFSGTAPTAVSIGLIAIGGTLVCALRQMYLRRSRGCLTLCCWGCLAVYQAGLFITGIASQLTVWHRLPVFLLTLGYNCIAAWLLYPLMYKIGTIGGNTWKE